MVIFSVKANVSIVILQLAKSELISRLVVVERVVVREENVMLLCLTTTVQAVAIKSDGENLSDFKGATVVKF